MARRDGATSFLIVSHSVTPGIAGDIRRYLLEDRCRALWYITHDFDTLETRKSHLEHYRDGELVEKRSSPDFRLLPGPLVNLKDFLYTVAWVVLRVRRADVYIGLSGADTACGILLKRLLRTEHIIYYSIDFIPVRFRNKLINRLYHGINDFALKHSSEIWDLSPVMKEARESLRGLKEKDLPEQRVVTRGIWPDTKRYGFDEINKSELVSVGNITEKLGLETLLEAIPLVLEHIPSFTFRLIGRGPYEGRVKEIVKRLGVGSHVIFEGFIPDDREMMDKLSRAALAVALYDRDKDDFSVYADPAKIKICLAAGLPILMTDLPHNAGELAEKGCARVIDLEPQAVADAVIEILGNENILRNYRECVLSYWNLLDWNHILDESLGRLL